MLKKKLLVILPLLVFIIGLIQMGVTAFANTPTERPDVNFQITKFSKWNGTNEPVKLGESFLLEATWDAKKYDGQLKEGDYFVLNFSKEVNFSATDAKFRNFDLRNEGGEVVAKAVITPNPVTDANNGGGTIKITFTKWVENKNNVSGTFSLFAKFNVKAIPEDAKTAHITVTVANSVVLPPLTSGEVTIDRTKPKLRPDATWLQKGAWGVENFTKVQWLVLINHEKANLTNAVITDKLTTGKDGLFIDPDSFVLEEVSTVINDEFGIVLVDEKKPKIPVSLEGKLDLNKDLKGYTLRLGDISGKTYRLMYKTNYDVGIQVGNDVKLEADQVTPAKQSYAGYFEGASGGTGKGDLTGKIKIIKYDADDAKIKLPNATFKVTSQADQSTFTLTTEANGEIVSNKLTPGKYTIVETQAPDGYVLDTTPIEVEVKADAPVVKGIPNKKKEAVITLEARKNLIGKALQDQQFHFELTEKDNPQFPPVTVKNDGDGKIVFPAIKITSIGEKRYLIKEIAGQDKNIKYDTKQVEVVVNVTAGQDGNLTADVTYDGKKDIPSFTNTYTPNPVRVPIRANKVLNGRTLKAEEFTFTLTSAEPMAPQATPSEVKNAENGAVEFFVEFTKTGTFNYTLAEKTDVPISGITFAKTPNVGVVVEVTDNNGQLEATVSYNNQADVPTITNTYTVSPGKVQFHAKKVLNGKTLTGGEFSFELKDHQNGVLQKKSNIADGSITFDSISVTEVGEKHYTISEVAGNAAGITYDSTIYNVTVRATDNGDGTLNITTTYQKNNQDVTDIVFTNSYVPGSTSVNIQAKKVLTGSTLMQGMFQFELVDEQKNISVASNNVDGSIAFAPITYTKPGTYTYTLSEKDEKKPGITYDKTIYQVQVNVVDNNGQLQATVSYNGKADVPVFKNEYTTQPVTWTPTAKKRLLTLSGTELSLTAGEFQFELKDSTGKVLETLGNTDKGEITFKPLTYTQPGDYQYIISEITGNNRYILFDKTVYRVHVQVTDNGAGQLVATATVEGGKDILFKNQFIPPYIPEKPNTPEEPPTPEKPNEPNEPNEPGEKPNTPIKPLTPPVVIQKPKLPQTGAKVIAVAWLGVLSLGLAGVLFKRK